MTENLTRIYFPYIVKLSCCYAKNTHENFIDIIIVPQKYYFCTTFRIFNKKLKLYKVLLFMNFYNV